MYNVGEVVKIIDGVNLKKEHKALGFVPDMEKYLGSYMTIKDVKIIKQNDNADDMYYDSVFYPSAVVYIMDKDNGMYEWCSALIEGRVER